MDLSTSYEHPGLTITGIPSAPVIMDTPTSLEGTMRDLELSPRHTPVDSLLSWLKPWFNLSHEEYCLRCQACLIAYACLEVKCAHIMRLTSFDYSRSGSGFFGGGQLSPPKLASEECIDASTASAANLSAAAADPAAPEPPAAAAVSDPPIPTGSMLPGVVYSGPARISHHMSASSSSSVDCVPSNLRLGALEGFSDAGHPVFETLRRMWDTPDLYGFVWNNVLSALCVFTMCCFHQQCTDKIGPLATLAPLYHMIMICWSCSLCTSGSIIACRVFSAGSYEGGIFVPVLCVSGYLQPLLLLLFSLSMWHALAAFYIPFVAHFIRFLQVVSYMYFFVSVSSALVLYVPPLDDLSQDMRFKLSSSVCACVIELLFFFWLSTYL